MKDSKIEWTDHTFNPWIGCTKVSPGCANCYAETQDVRRFSKTLPGCSKDAPVSHWGKGASRYRTKAANWEEPVKWDREAAARIEAFRPGMSRVDVPLARPRVFCASLADWLDDEVPVEWLADLLELVHRTPHLDWLLLTKRPEKWRKRMDDAYARLFLRGQETYRWLMAWRDGNPPANVWIGTTMEDQARAVERMPHLASIPARVHFVSAEPLLGEVDLVKAAFGCDESELGPEDELFISWVICGGESGPTARPMHPEWARKLRDQCARHGVAFFFKQWGEWHPANDLGGSIEMRTGGSAALPYKSPSWFRFPDEQIMGNVGKAAAGRLLDGCEWNEVPEVSR